MTSLFATNRNGHTLGIIPARGGSRRIPGKNIYPLCGKPLIQFSIESAIRSCVLDDLIISTDSATIASVAREAGANVPFLRPAELATDTSSSLEVLQHAIREYENQSKKKLSTIVLIQPTSPLVTPTDIEEAVITFRNEPEADSLVSVCRVGHEHPWRMYRLNESFLHPILDQTPRLFLNQDVEPLYVRNGAIWIATRQLIMEKGMLVGDRLLGYVMPRERSINIDEPIDLKIAEILLRDLTGTQQPQ